MSASWRGAGCSNRRRKICKDTELVPLVRLQFAAAGECAQGVLVRNVTDARGREFDGSVVLGALGSSRAIYAAAAVGRGGRIAEAWARAHGII